MKAYSLLEVAKAIYGEVHCLPEQLVDNVASLSLANARSIACFSHEEQLPFLRETQAQAIITTLSLAHLCPLPYITVLCVPSISERLLSLFEKDYLRLISNKKNSIIHETAVISDDAIIGEHVKIGPHVVIGAGAQVGNGCVIDANTVVSENVTLKNNVKLSQGVKVLHNTLSACHSIVDAGAVIGSNPYNPTKKQGKWQLLDPVGGVLIGEHTRIGANTTIDKGVFSDTYIGNHVVIDNLVQIAHDVMISDNTVVAASAIIGANTAIGEHCTIGGGCSISGQLSIASDTVLTGRTTVSRSLLKPGIYSSGVTAQPHDKWRKNVARFHRLDASIKELKKLRKELEKVES